MKESSGENNKFCRSLLINFNISDAFGSDAAFNAGTKKISHDTFGEISKAFLNIIELYKQNRIPEIKSAFQNRRSCCTAAILQLTK
ncbi:MAG: hypothetical protein SPL89_09210 [Clostridia bacterium]|nr:hypothetical protein [Clostridia bacterium]